MRSRGLWGVVAAILTVVGAIFLMVYVKGADSRAIAGQQPTNVLVVTKEVPRGTEVADLTTSVEVRRLPKAAVVPGSVTDVKQLQAGYVSTTTLKPGEQVLSARFAKPDSEEFTTSVEVPPGLQVLSLQLEPQRVVGSTLKAGDTVGIYLSATVTMSAGAKQTPTAQAETKDVATTAGIAHRVLVVRVQGAVTPTSNAAPSNTPDKTPGGAVIVTLAVDADLAERLVFGQEFGKLWLTSEKADSSITGADGVTAGNVFG